MICKRDEEREELQDQFSESQRFRNLLYIWGKWRRAAEYHRGDPSR